MGWVKASFLGVILPSLIYSADQNSASGQPAGLNTSTTLLNEVKDRYFYKVREGSDLEMIRYLHSHPFWIFEFDGFLAQSKFLRTNTAKKQEISKFMEAAGILRSQGKDFLAAVFETYVAILQENLGLNSKNAFRKAAVFFEGNGKNYEGVSFDRDAIELYRRGRAISEVKRIVKKLVSIRAERDTSEDPRTQLAEMQSLMLFVRLGEITQESENSNLYESDRGITVSTSDRSAIKNHRIPLFYREFWRSLRLGLQRRVDIHSWSEYLEGAGPPLLSMIFHASGAAEVKFEQSPASFFKPGYVKFDPLTSVEALFYSFKKSNQNFPYSSFIELPPQMVRDFRLRSLLSDFMVRPVVMATPTDLDPFVEVEIHRWFDANGELSEVSTHLSKYVLAAKGDSRVSRSSEILVSHHRLARTDYSRILPIATSCSKMTVNLTDLENPKTPSLDSEKD